MILICLLLAYSLYVILYNGHFNDSVPLCAMPSLVNIVRARKQRVTENGMLYPAN